MLLSSPPSFVDPVGTNGKPGGGLRRPPPHVWRARAGSHRTSVAEFGSIPSSFSSQPGELGHWWSWSPQIGTRVSRDVLREIDAFGLGRELDVVLAPGRGHGHTLVQWLIDMARKQRNILYLSLSSLPAAIRFYKHLGFRQAPRACGGGRVAALVLRRTFAGFS